MHFLKFTLDNGNWHSKIWSSILITPFRRKENMKADNFTPESHPPLNNNTVALPMKFKATVSVVNNLST
ncbi:hypothetical protein RIF29_37531 [Crotalaria pallida]|uniref:Uncharacterized protein n=1 Tax=Crotalaria pallida TaxID=3830 RepID=A0AAN9EEH0_CROPI